MTEIIYSRGANPDYSMGAGQPRTATLMTMAQDILVRLRNSAIELGVELPSRQFIYPTNVPIDCEQVAVVFNGWTGEPSEPGLVACMRFRWCGQFGVAIGRCTPAMPPRGSSSAPSVDKMMAAAALASADAELLIHLVSTFGEIGSDLTLITPEPEGGFQATFLQVTLPAFGGLD